MLESIGIITLPLTLAANNKFTVGFSRFNPNNPLADF
jgi:hypothetical protein